jgi:hypothetical protein
MRSVPSPVSERVEESDHIDENEKESILEESIVHRTVSASVMGFLMDSLKTRTDSGKVGTPESDNRIDTPPQDHNIEAVDIRTPQFVSKEKTGKHIALIGQSDFKGIINLRYELMGSERDGVLRECDKISKPKSPSGSDKNVDADDEKNGALDGGGYYFKNGVKKIGTMITMGKESSPSHIYKKSIFSKPIAKNSDDLMLGSNSIESFGFMRRSTHLSFRPKSDKSQKSRKGKNCDIMSDLTSNQSKISLGTDGESDPTPKRSKSDRNIEYKDDVIAGSGLCIRKVSNVSEISQSDQEGKTSSKKFTGAGSNPFRKNTNDKSQTSRVSVSSKKMNFGELPAREGYNSVRSMGSGRKVFKTIERAFNKHAKKAKGELKVSMPEL